MTQFARRLLAVTTRTGVAGALAALVLSTSPVDAQNHPGFGRTHVAPVERSDRGEWHGTWYYANRDMRFVLWLRSNGEAVALKAQVATTLAPPELFVTDWNGSATYNMERGSGTFQLELTSSDPDTLKGNWTWDLDLKDSARLEHGAFEAYRGGDGRMLVLNFSDFERVYRRGQKYETYPSRHTMTFRKVSKRLVQWDEIPF
jgi:hypothetical protein